MSTPNSGNQEYGRLFGPLYRRFVRPWIGTEIHRQRLKLIYDIWSYWPLLRFAGMRWQERMTLLCNLIRTDWFILQGSKPAEIVPVLLDLMSRSAKAHEVFVEAGCWNGGATAKFSIVCRRYGYALHIFDSFQGVKEWDYAYAAKETDVRKNIERYGALEVCTFHPGWFKDTLWQRPLLVPVRMAYIDCDVPDGTLEALSGIVPALVGDGVIYSQDYHLSDVRSVIDNPMTWARLGPAVPSIKPVIRNLARISWH